MNEHDPDTTEQRYPRFYRKTGRLFEAGREVAAVLAGATVTQQAPARALRQTSRHGVSARRQTRSYKSDPANRGKNLGDDLPRQAHAAAAARVEAGDDEQRALIDSP